MIIYKSMLCHESGRKQLTPMAMVSYNSKLCHESGACVCMCVHVLEATDTYGYGYLQ